MRRIMFTVLACTALFAAVPAAALAHNGHHHKRHHRVRHEHFIGHRHSSDVNGVPGTEPTAGTVTSFTNNVLTITLTNGNTVSGDVTNDTEVNCENADNVGDNGDNAEQNDLVRDNGPSGGGDDNGPSGGDDNGAGDDDNQGADDNNDNTCTITPGMAVRKAELRIDGNGAVWDEVELISSSTTSSTSPAQS